MTITSRRFHRWRLSANRQIIVEVFPTDHRRALRLKNRQIIVEIGGGSEPTSRWRLRPEPPVLCRNEFGGEAGCRAIAQRFPQESHGWLAGRVERGSLGTGSPAPGKRRSNRRSSTRRGPAPADLYLVDRVAAS